ncbi:MAG: CRISPR-associated RAMP protein [Blastochloris sp.]|nr:CRISPR-associated RAMP protein [Blastochloris sp.]
MLRGLESLYICKGFLELQTPLHIGGGDVTVGTTDSPVMRTTEGQPFIPGSSLKGSFRNTVEKLALTLGLPNTDKDVLDTSSDWIKSFNDSRVEEAWTDSKVVERVKAEWPATALLFGNPYTASKIFFADAYLQSESFTTIQRRDGVAIDRDSECAMDGLKYDYEVVVPTLRFNFELRLENPSREELALACLGLSELLSGFFSLGGQTLERYGSLHAGRIRSVYARSHAGQRQVSHRAASTLLNGENP